MWGNVESEGGVPHLLLATILTLSGAIKKAVTVTIWTFWVDKLWVEAERQLLMSPPGEQGFRPIFKCCFLIGWFGSSE